MVRSCAAACTSYAYTVAQPVGVGIRGIRQLAFYREGRHETCADSDGAEKRATTEARSPMGVIPSHQRAPIRLMLVPVLATRSMSLLKMVTGYARDPVVSQGLANVSRSPILHSWRWASILSEQRSCSAP